MRRHTLLIVLLFLSGFLWTGCGRPDPRPPEEADALETGSPLIRLKISQGSLVTVVTPGPTINGSLTQFGTNVAVTFDLSGTTMAGQPVGPKTRFRIDFDGNGLQDVGAISTHTYANGGWAPLKVVVIAANGTSAEIDIALVLDCTKMHPALTFNPAAVIITQNGENNHFQADFSQAVHGGVPPYFVSAFDANDGIMDLFKQNATFSFWTIIGGTRDIRAQVTDACGQASLSGTLSFNYPLVTTNAVPGTLQSPDFPGYTFLQGDIHDVGSGASIRGTLQFRAARTGTSPPSPVGPFVGQQLFDTQSGLLTIMAYYSYSAPTVPSFEYNGYKWTLGIPLPPPSQWTNGDNYYSGTGPSTFKAAGSGDTLRSRDFATTSSCQTQGMFQVNETVDACVYYSCTPQGSYGTAVRRLYAGMVDGTVSCGNLSPQGTSTADHLMIDNGAYVIFINQEFEDSRPCFDATTTCQPTTTSSGSSGTSTTTTSTSTSGTTDTSGTGTTGTSTSTSTTTSTGTTSTSGGPHPH